MYILTSLSHIVQKPMEKVRASKNDYKLFGWGKKDLWKIWTLIAMTIMLNAVGCWARFSIEHEYKFMP